MVFENGVKNILAAAYNGARTVYKVNFDKISETGGVRESTGRKISKKSHLCALQRPRSTATIIQFFFILAKFSLMIRVYVLQKDRHVRFFSFLFFMAFYNEISILLDN